MKQEPTLKQYLRRPFLVLAMIGILPAVQSVHADTITFSSYADHGPGTLRQALADAHDGDTILTPSGGTIDLSDPLVVDKSITISGGPSATNFWLIGNGTRVFYIGVGKTVTISGVNITNGYDDVRGGAIYNDHSTLTVSNCTVSGNFVLGNGGGIYNDGSEGSAMLTINNCELHGNQAYLGKGGCIYNDGSVGSATVRVINSTLGYNSAGSGGGGIANNAIDAIGSASVTIINSTLSYNAAGSGGGGGIENKGDGHGSATVTINNSTLSSNSAAWVGGGVSNTGVSGGVATLTVRNSTVSGNSASTGGGIYNGTPLGAATLAIWGSILKTGDSGENISSDIGDVVSLGYNLSNDDGGGFLTAMGDQINTDPQLGPLQDNGGPTFTHELLSGSPAIDGGDPSFTPPPDYDQRGSGFARVVNGRIDIGAFELQTVTLGYAAQIQAPIDADGTSIFSARRGVIPVKFTLTQGGVATCDLPLATIAVTRTGGGVMGQVNESLYSGNADAGSNFRIDSCQYVYNLNSSALGVGTYRVDILIDGQVVGSAVLTLK